MYCILTDSIKRIIYLGEKKGWVIISSSGRDKGTVDILDYSDWSIETVRLNDLMDAIAYGRFLISDFLNLSYVSVFVYDVTISYIFTSSRRIFTASGLTLRLDNDLYAMDVELSDGRCLSLHQTSTNTDVFAINYKRCVQFSDSHIYMNDACGSTSALVPYSEGYKFKLDSGIKVFLKQKCFTVISGKCRHSFEYVSKADLARRKLMSRL